MTCACLTSATTNIIKFVCDEIEDLDTENRWTSYLTTLDDKYKTASFRWTFTKTDSRLWFERVLRNMKKADLIGWAHKEQFCMNQYTPLKTRKCKKANTIC